MATEHVPLVAADAQVGPGSKEARQDGAHRGQVVHQALQFLRLDRAADLAQVEGEIRRLVAEGVLSEEDVSLVDAQALVWFFDTDLGRRIRGADAGDYLREWMFVAAEPVQTFDPTVGGGDGDDVLVRGVVDGVLVTAEGVEIVDFKTDRVSADAVRSRAAEYAMQMRLYSSAVADVFSQSVTTRHLVFLHCRQIVEV